MQINPNGRVSNIILYYVDMKQRSQQHILRQQRAKTYIISRKRKDSEPRKRKTSEAEKYETLIL